MASRAVRASLVVTFVTATAAMTVGATPLVRRAAAPGSIPHVGPLDVFAALYDTSTSTATDRATWGSAARRFARAIRSEAGGHLDVSRALQGAGDEYLQGVLTRRARYFDGPSGSPTWAALSDYRKAHDPRAAAFHLPAAH